MNELTYHREGDYLLPDLIPPATPRIGIWGMRRREFLRNHRGGKPYNSQIDHTSYNTIFPNYDYSQSMVTSKTKVNYWYRYVGGDPAGYVNATVKIDKYTGEIISSYIQ